MVGGQHHVPAALSTEKGMLPFVGEVGFASAPTWFGPENLAPSRLCTPDFLAPSVLLYRLLYPGLIMHYTPSIPIYTAFRNLFCTFYYHSSKYWSISGPAGTVQATHKKPIA